MRRRERVQVLTCIGDFEKESDCHACTKSIECPTPRKSLNEGKDLHSPSVRVSAMRNSENGGKCNLAFNVANTEARITKGAMILNIYRKRQTPPFSTNINDRMHEGITHQQRRHREWTKYRNQSIDWVEVERSKSTYESAKQKQKTKCSTLERSRNGKTGDSRDRSYIPRPKKRDLDEKQEEQRDP
jgi:hypothetical protein